MTTHHTTESVERLGNWLALSAGPNQIDQWNALIAERDALRARLDEAEKDVARIDLIQSEYLDVKCFPIPTGQGDADVGWIAVNHHEGTPSEKTVAEVFTDDCRAALDEARAFLNGGGNG